MQNSLILKRPSEHTINNNSLISEENNNSTARPLVRKYITKPPMQVPRTILNVSQMAEKPPTPSINNSMVSDKPPMSKIVIGRMRGSSLLGKQKTQESNNPLP